MIEEKNKTYTIAHNGLDVEGLIYSGRGFRGLEA